MSKIRKNRKKAILVFLLLLIAVLFVLWAVQFSKTNSRKYEQKVELYKTGETVELGDNFFIEARENINGYSVKVNSAKLVNYQEYYESSGQPFHSEQFSKAYPAPKYTGLLNVTLKNIGNTNGGVMVRQFALYNGALQIPPDFELWGMFDERFEGYPSLTLVENSEVELTIPFTPMTLNTGTNSAKLEKLMEKGEFYLCVCEFPVRKMIKVSLTDTPEESKRMGEAESD